MKGLARGFAITVSLGSIAAFCWRRPATSILTNDNYSVTVAWDIRC